MQRYSAMKEGSKVICSYMDQPEDYHTKRSPFSSVQSCPTLCNPMDCSTPGLPVHHQISEFTQTYAH